MKNLLRRKAVVALSTVALVASAGMLIAGPVTPPGGPVASTYKTLNEVEPRIAINAANTPGDANSVYQISKPGSYYLTGNVTAASGKTCIEVTASHVTLDLNGFEVVGVQGGLLGIIATGNSQTNITIQNGTVRDCAGGGINTATASAANTVVRNIRAIHNATEGIWAGDGALIENCVASENGLGGIRGGTNATVLGCVARSNAAYGISVLTGGIVSDCNVWASGNNGIVTGSAGIVKNSASSSNGNVGISIGVGSTAQGNTSYGNGNVGLLALSACHIESNMVRTNMLDGIRVTEQCTIVGNNCSGNGAGNGTGAGIHTTGLDNRIEGNTCTGADTGIDVDMAGNIIIKNTCSGNTTNWAVIQGNKCLVVNAANCGNILGDAGGTALGTNDPNANFTY